MLYTTRTCTCACACACACALAHHMHAGAGVEMSWIHESKDIILLSLNKTVQWQLKCDQ